MGIKFNREQVKYGELYLHARSREAAIEVLQDYLQMVDHFERHGFKLVRYGAARGFAEARIAIIYDELGEHQTAKTFMERALNDIHQDKAFKDADEARLRTIVTKLDAANSPDWRKN
jgi:tetratricopeptide (TPR) repeat protein